MHVPKPPTQGPPAEGRRAPQRSILRYSSNDTGSSTIPVVTASSAALPTLNNRILQQHTQQFQALQHQMLVDHLLQWQHTAADALAEDDAPMLEARYAHMAEVALPERDPQTFDAWRAEMQLRLQQQLNSSQIQPVQSEKQNAD